MVFLKKLEPSRKGQWTHARHRMHAPALALCVVQKNNTGVQVVKAAKGLFHFQNRKSPFPPRLCKSHILQKKDLFLPLNAQPFVWTDKTEIKWKSLIPIPPSNESAEEQRSRIQNCIMIASHCQPLHFFFNVKYYEGLTDQQDAHEV